MSTKYAVLISGDLAETGYDEFWNDVVLMHEALIQNGLEANHIYVLYGDGSDYFDTNRPNPRYRPSPAITNFEATQANVTNIFTNLAHGTGGMPQVTTDDLLFIWTFDHGDSDGTHSKLHLRDGNMLDTTFSMLVNQIPYACRIICMQQCFSGGFIPYLSSNRTVIMTACTANQFGNRADTEKEVVSGVEYHHGEFDFHLLAALTGHTVTGTAVSADTNLDGFVTMGEVFNYIQNNDSITNETPQYNGGTGGAPLPIGDRLHFTSPPPFVERIAVLSAVPGLGTTPDGFGRLQNCPDPRVIYEARWWEVNDAERVCLRGGGLSKLPLSSDHEAVIFLIFGPTNGGTHGGRAVQDLTLNLHGTTPVGGPVQISVPMQAAFDEQRGVYYWGRFQPPQGNSDSAYTLYMTIIAHDESGNDLDSYPSTIADGFAPFKAYEPGPDKHHSLEIAPAIMKDDLDNNEFDKAYRIHLKLGEQHEVAGTLTHLGEEDFFRLSCEGEEQPVTVTGPYGFKMGYGVFASAETDPSSVDGPPYNTILNLKEYDSNSNYRGSGSWLSIDPFAPEFPGQVAVVAVSTPTFPCDGSVRYVFRVSFERTASGADWPRAIVDWWHRHHIPPGDPYFRVNKDYAKSIDEARHQLERIARTGPTEDQTVAATILYYFGKCAHLVRLDRDAEALYKIGAETFGRLGNRSMQVQVLKDLEALYALHGRGIDIKAISKRQGNIGES